MPLAAPGGTNPAILPLRLQDAPGVSSKGRNREKSGDSSISWFRTARGRAVSLPPPCANPLIFWLKRRLRSKRERPPAVSPTALLRFGSPGRTRTSDQAVNSRSLYQLSYRGSGRPSMRAQPLEAGSGIEPLYEGLQSWPGFFSEHLVKPFYQCFQSCMRYPRSRTTPAVLGFSVPDYTGIAQEHRASATLI